MLDINDYTTNMRWLLAEVGKYFLLLVVCVLAIRLWRRWGNVSAASGGYFFGAGLTTVLAVLIGCVFMKQSLNSLYSHYGMRAFREGRLLQALTLFETAERNWRNAGSLGQQGVCHLLLGDTDKGLALIAQARMQRHDAGTAFENFYEGLYYFTKGDNSRAVPLLQSAGGDDAYRWSVIKIFAVMELDAGQIEVVAEQMRPYMMADVTDYDQAYIMAMLKLADGRKAEAKALLEKYPSAGFSRAWQDRYEKLNSRLRD